MMSVEMAKIFNSLLDPADDDLPSWLPMMTPLKNPKRDETQDLEDIFYGVDVGSDDDEETKGAVLVTRTTASMAGSAEDSSAVCLPSLPIRLDVLIGF